MSEGCLISKQGRPLALQKDNHSLNYYPPILLLLSHLLLWLAPTTSCSTIDLFLPVGKTVNIAINGVVERNFYTWKQQLETKMERCCCGDALVLYFCSNEHFGRNVSSMPWCCNMTSSSGEMSWAQWIRALSTIKISPRHNWPAQITSNTVCNQVHWGCLFLLPPWTRLGHDLN